MLQGSRGRPRAASEDGFALIEVVVSASVLVLVVLGVLAAMDAVTSTAGANKARTVAATLAEKDQERMRGMRTLDIDQMDLSPYTLDVAGVTYTIQSDARWINDASGEDVSCGMAADEASYMRITSTVTSPITGAAVKPVVLSSLVSPQVGAASQGTLSVLVKNAADQPVAGLRVSATPTGRQELTNAAGCAVFGRMDAGNYTVSLNTPGWVDKQGVQNAAQPANVTAGNLSTVEFAYDRAAQLPVRVRTMLNGGVDDPAKTVVAANVSLTTGRRAFTPTNWSATLPVAVAPFAAGFPGSASEPTGTTFLLTNLFPFTNGYALYSGGCIANDPTKYVTNYAAAHGGTAVLAPGQVGAEVTVYEPPTNLRVTRNGTDQSDVLVYAYPTNLGCTGTRIPMGQTVNGRLRFHGLPYGDYTICARSETSGRRATASLRVDDLDGPAAATIALGSTGTCGLTAP